MARRARVVSIKVISELRARLLTFRDEAMSILDSADAEVERIHRWVTQEQTAFWKSEMRRREDAVVQARSDLARAEAQKQMGKPSTLDERKALDRAKRAVEEAREKRALVARWSRTIDREMQIYRGQVQPMRTHLEGRLERGLALMARYSDSLEQYIALATPSSEEQARESAEEFVRREEKSPTPPKHVSPGDWRGHCPDAEPANLRECAEVIALLAEMLRPVTPSALRYTSLLGTSNMPKDEDWVVVTAPTDRESAMCLERVDPVQDGDSGWRIYSPGEDSQDACRVKTGALSRKISLFALLQAAPIGSLLVVQGSRVLAAFDAQDAPLSRTIDPGRAGPNTEDPA